jgi:hypothetical protein
MTHRRLFLAIAIAIASPRVAGAQPSDAKKRAQDLFAEASAAFARNDYATAARRYEEAAVHAPHPATLLNAAEAWELAGDAARAAELCDRVVSEPYLDARYNEAARLRLDRLRERVATLDFVGAPVMRVRIDDGPETSMRRARVMPGRHVLSFIDSTTKRVHRGVVEVAAGETRRIEAKVPDDARPAPAQAPRVAPVAPLEPGHREADAGRSGGGWGPPAGAWIAFGVAGASAAVGGYFGVQTLRSRDDFDATPNAATRDAFYRNRSIANGLFLAAGVAAVVGVVVWASTPRRDAQVGLAPAPDGARVVARVEF